MSNLKENINSLYERVLKENAFDKEERELERIFDKLLKQHVLKQYPRGSRLHNTSVEVYDDDEIDMMTTIFVPQDKMDSVSDRVQLNTVERAMMQEIKKRFKNIRRIETDVEDDYDSFTITFKAR